MVQRIGPETAVVRFRGKTLTEDPAQLRKQLQDMIAADGQNKTETFAYAFVGMDWSEELKFQLAGVTPAALKKVQQALKGVLTALQSEQRVFVDSFGPKVLDDTKKVLAKCKEALRQEEAKYADDVGGPPDMGALRQAAKALAAKRQAADAAAKQAQAANRAMVDQQLPKAEFGSPFPGPQMPYFPDPKLREQAGIANNAWWRLEQEYGALRTDREKAFPVLSIYAQNEDGAAAVRLDDLPTWGPLADYRMKNKLAEECLRRIGNVQEADSQLDLGKAWQLPRMVDATLRNMAAAAHQQRWAHDHAASLAAATAEREELIAAVTLAIMVVTAALTAGAALAVEGSIAAAALSSAAAVGSGLSAGMSIATAYTDLRDYQFRAAAKESALKNAEAISADEPSFFWVAVEIAAALADVGAARAAFHTTTKAIKAVRAGDQVLQSLKAIESSAGGAGEKIIGKVLDEAEASGALQKAIAAEGKQFSEATLAQMKDLISQGLGRTWEEEFEILKSQKRILPFTKEGLEGALGPKTAAKFMAEKGYEQTIGMYHLDTGKVFVRPAAEGDLAHSIVHEMTHRIQGPQSTKYASFIREFEAYAAQREMMRKLCQAYGWKPKSSSWLLEATDWDVAKHIRLEYGYPVPPWVLENPLSPTELDKAFQELTKRLARG